MDKNLLGANHPVFPIIFMRYNILHNASIPTHTNDSYFNIHIFSHFLEFLSIRIQVFYDIPNNINNILYSCIMVCNNWINLLDHSTLNV